jgi:hypothetical protein
MRPSVATRLTSSAYTEQLVERHRDILLAQNRVASRTRLAQPIGPLQLCSMEEEPCSTQATSPRRRRISLRFASYIEAQKIVQREGIGTSLEYKAWDRPRNMPSNPQQTFAGRGWFSWGDFLGNGRSRRQERRHFLSYEAAAALVRQARLQSEDAFFAWTRPPGMPANPRDAYLGHGWLGWHEFLGTAPLPYADASRLAVAAGIRTDRAFREWDRPVGVPSAPWKVYRGAGWSGMSAFLQTGTLSGFQPQCFVRFVEARLRVRTNAFPSSTAYLAWWRETRPLGLPGRPEIAYAGKGWAGWGDYLGNGRKLRADAVV